MVLTQEMLLRYQKNNGWVYLFTPSILCKVEFTHLDRPTKICHSFITDGKIQFLSDCTHSFAGKTVELPELPDF
jgi:hypothetical protein